VQILPRPTPSLLKCAAGSPKNQHRTGTRFDKEILFWQYQSKQLSEKLNLTWHILSFAINCTKYRKHQQLLQQVFPITYWRCVWLALSKCLDGASAHRVLQKKKINKTQQNPRKVRITVPKHRGPHFVQISWGSLWQMQTSSSCCRLISLLFENCTPCYSGYCCPRFSWLPVFFPLQFTSWYLLF